MHPRHIDLIGTWGPSTTPTARPGLILWHCPAPGCHSGDMDAVSSPAERRRTPRQAGSGMVCLSLDSKITRARLSDFSDGGLRIQTRAAIQPGEILYCAVPSLAVCTRARVAYVRRGLLRTTAGIEYLATLSDFC